MAFIEISSTSISLILLDYVCYVMHVFFCKFTCHLGTILKKTDKSIDKYIDVNVYVCTYVHTIYVEIAKGVAK